MSQDINKPPRSGVSNAPPSTTTRLVEDVRTLKEEVRMWKAAFSGLATRIQDLEQKVAERK